MPPSLPPDARHGHGGAVLRRGAPSCAELVEGVAGRTACARPARPVASRGGSSTVGRDAVRGRGEERRRRARRCRVRRLALKGGGAGPGPQLENAPGAEGRSSPRYAHPGISGSIRAHTMAQSGWGTEVGYGSADARKWLVSRGLRVAGREARAPRFMPDTWFRLCRVGGNAPPLRDEGAGREGAWMKCGPGLRGEPLASALLAGLPRATRAGMRGTCA